MNNDNEIFRTCLSCEVSEASEYYHTCPFLIDVHDDYTECDCCDECTQRCADDI